MSVTLLADAVRSEAYRFSRNRMAVFWSVVFVPVILLVLGVFGEIMKQRMMGAQSKLLPPLAPGALDLGHGLVKLAGDLANPMILMFILIGAATIFAGDYRWETWRLISARNTRVNLILGKVGVAKLMTLAALVLMLAFGFVGDLANGVIQHRSYAFTFGGTEAGQFVLLFVVGFIRVMQVALIGLFAAVLTRSLLATLFVPLVVTIAQFFLMQAIPLLGWNPGDWIAQLLIPGLAYDSLKAVITGAVGLPAHLLLKAVLGLALWTLAPLAAALALFQRQDLSKE